MEFRRYAAWVPGYGKPLLLIASGPNSGELSWTRGFFEALASKGKTRSTASIDLLCIITRGICRAARLSIGIREREVP